MTLNIHITIVAHSLDIRPVVRSIMGDGVTVHVFLHSHNPTVVEGANALLREYAQGVMLWGDGQNSGLARSWNIGLKTAQRCNADVMMIANDDIEATYADVQLIAMHAYHYPDYYMVSGLGDDLTTGEHKDMLFALCAINPIAIDTIGYFDEQFAPIYFEDLDYYRRADLARLERGTLRGTSIRHVGSGTRKARPDDEAQFWTDFERNKALYVSKWGGNGHRGTEQYTTPYNDPTKGLRIE